MRVHKPKVKYKLALQEKPQGSILTYYCKRKNLTRINWLNTRLIIASNKIRHEIPFKTKRVKYTAIWKKSIKIVKESKLSFFTTFPSSIFFYSLLHNFVIFAPHSWIPSSSSLLFSLLLFIFIVYPPPPPPPPPPSIIIEMRRRWRENNKNEEKVSLKLASKNLVRSKLKAPYGRGFPYGLLQAENTRSARCSESKFFISARARKKIAVLEMFANARKDHSSPLKLFPCTYHPFNSGGCFCFSGHIS